MPYKVAGTMDTAIRTFKNPFPFRPNFPFYCPLDSTDFYDIDYDLIPEETSTNYCEHTREFCIIEQIIDKTNIEIPSFLPTDSALWLDADDSSTLTLVSGAVSEWRDKSGNNRHATQANASRRPLLVANGLNGTDVIRFDGVNDFLQATYSINGLNEVTFFVVGKRGINGDFSSFLNTDYSASPPKGIIIRQSNSLNAFSVDGRPQGSSFIRATLSPQLSSFSIIFSKITNTGMQIGANGLLGNSVFYSVSTIVSGSSLFIGTAIGNTFFSDVDISQIIIFPRVLTQAEREQIEGYLAWSTGLQGNLPSGHPYKNSYNGVTVTEQTICTDFYDFAQAP